ncbi:MAG TPA: hydrogen gas-evolving membrane-bound hydrogenase subunit E [Geminicoccaceae bacterium]|nr:hydrogen gas-evolving membrane-bound hydrogenase subunit E [Geminicoccaceae bacterium]
MQLLLILVLPFFGALLTPVVGRAGRLAGTLVAVAAPALGLLLLLQQASPVLAGEVVVVGWSWIPAFGLDLALRLDGLSFLFALLVLAIGLLVLVYSHGYLPKDEPLDRFLGLMLGFMGGMLGIVLAENLLLLVLFWEITSLSSFLLIGFQFRDAEARRAALMALTITGAGGLALLGGVLLLGSSAGSFNISEALAARDRIGSDALGLPMLLLIVLAAFTKSAQLPLHFWLPNAMVAPTPVSAYLHSAAMVKAGIYLLARLWPVLSELDLWAPLVAGVGLATMLVAAWYALFQSDIKALLAYSTISQLGMLVMLLGLGSAYAVVVAAFHVLNHAVFKCALFMVAGIVDHATGSRDLDRLGGLWRVLPLTSTVALIAAAALTGLPPLNGYISKEMMLEAVTEHGPATASWLLPALVALGALLSAAYGLAFAWRAFLAPASRDQHEAHRPNAALWLPAAVLAALCLAIGLFPAALAGPLVDAAAGAIVPGPLPHYELALWHGVNLPFALGVGALTGGLLLAAARPRLAGWPGLLPAADALFESTYNRVIGGARALVHGLHNQSAQRYLAIVVGAMVVAGAIAGSAAALAAGNKPPLPIVPFAVVGWAILAVAVGGTIWMRERRVIALVLVSVVGLVVVMAYVHLSAPDLALTQLTVEIITTILVLLAIRVLPLPEARPRERVARRVRDGGLALLAGAGAGVLAWAVMLRPRQPVVAREVLAEAVQGEARNLVHLVLVDFRALDTLGEISVLMIAALGVFALVQGFLDLLGEQRLRRRMVHPERAWDPHPLQFVVASRLLLPFALLVSVFLFLRGEAHPGGGFVAGLVAAMAILLQYMAHGVDWTERRIQLKYRPIVAAGVLVAVLTGVASMAAGAPFLTHGRLTMHWPVIGEVELTTTLLFDLGVFLTVAGATLLAMVNIGRIETRVPEPAESPDGL